MVFGDLAMAGVPSPAVLSEERMARLEGKVSSLESKAGQIGIVAWLFAAFCALWAQNTGHSAWL
jgi:hypothetical protein